MVKTKYDCILFKEGDNKEETEKIEDEDDSLVLKCGLCEYKAPSTYSLQAHWTRGCPGQAKVLLECGVCLQKFKDILDIDSHWQSTQDCWSGKSDAENQVK